MKRIANRTTGLESSAPAALREFRTVLARVTDALDRGDSNQSATAPLAEFIQQRIQCSVVSFWSLLGQGDDAVMSRIGGHDAITETVLTEPLVLPASEFNMQTLVDAAICIVHPHASSGSAPAMPVDDTLCPARIDVTIAANGVMFGILRCEFNGRDRPWRQSETTLLRSFAGEIALRRARRRARRN